MGAPGQRLTDTYRHAKREVPFFRLVEEYRPLVAAAIRAGQLTLPGRPKLGRRYKRKEPA